MVCISVSTVASASIAGTRFADQLERLRADDVDAQNFAVFLVGHHLHEAVVRPRMVALLFASEREFADLHFAARRRAPALRSSPTLPMPGSV